jgi:hypothetical protein
MSTTNAPRSREDFDRCAVGLRPGSLGGQIGRFILRHVYLGIYQPSEFCMSTPSKSEDALFALVGLVAAQQ